jgi:acetoin:2,6-dichlorophenolindophenol oxidoreductase subunit beta
MTALTYAAALDAAMADEMRDDPSVFCMGNALLPKALLDEFGPERVRRAPISEPAMTGMSIGAAGSGLRPVVLWRNVTFSFVALDQVINQAAKIHYMFGGQKPFPIVFRAYCGGGFQLAAQHSQSPYAIFAHVPGLKVILPSSPSDAYGLLRTAIRDDNPVVCLEASRLDPITEEFSRGTESIVPFGEARTRRQGSDVTIVALAYMVELALAAAAQLEQEGISVEVIDPRSIVPLDRDAILASVERTGRLVVVDEAPMMCSVASEIAATVAADRAALRALRSPIERVNAAAVPVPYSPALEAKVLPSEDDVVSAVHKVMEA